MFNYSPVYFQKQYAILFLTANILTMLRRDRFQLRPLTGWFLWICIVPTLLSSFALRCRPAGAPNQLQPPQITHFYTITSRSLPAHGWVRVSPVCLPLCANFRPIICCNKCAMGRVTFTLIVCTQRGSFPPHHGSKVSSIVSNFLFPFLATVCCFFSLSQLQPKYSAV